MLVPVPSGFYSVLQGSVSADLSLCLALSLSPSLLPGPVTCDDVDLYIVVMDGAILADIHGIYSKGWLKKGLSMYPLHGVWDAYKKVALKSKGVADIFFVCMPTILYTVYLHNIRYIQTISNRQSTCLPTRLKI